MIWQIETMKRQLASITFRIHHVQSEVAMVGSVATKEGLTKYAPTTFHFII